MGRYSGLWSLAITWFLAANGVVAAPSSGVHDARANTAPRMVFAHLIVGILGDRSSPADYDADMLRAKSFGIDAFALNIGTDPYTDQQLGYAYASAANHGMKVFISFDFNSFNDFTAGPVVGAKIRQYANKTAQLMIDGKVFASSFVGDNLNVTAMREAAGYEVFWAPNFYPGSPHFGEIDGALSWQAWDSNGNNKAPTPGANVTVEEGDAAYVTALNGRPYIAPVSPWFFTHYGAEVSYSKNWVFPSDLLWFRRWSEILTLGPRFVEIVTWNDYGESHYVGPLSSKHYDDGASKWANDMPHDGWLEMAKPFIRAFKAGKTHYNEFITQDQLIYWYRPTLSTINCDATDTCTPGANNASGNYFVGRPNGYQTLSDSIFVVAMLKSGGSITVTSGSQPPQTFHAQPGAHAFSAPLGVGPQSFSLTRGGLNIFSGTSLRDVSSVCPCGIYNFNAFVGTLPPGQPDPMNQDGLGLLTVGLHVTTCSATPSLATSAAYTTGGRRAAPTG